MTTTLTDVDKIRRVTAWLERGHLFSEGGYQFDSTVHAGRLFVATADRDGATTLRVFEVMDLPAWYDAAAGHVEEEDPGDREEWPGDDASDFGVWGEALNETEPPEARP